MHMNWHMYVTYHIWHGSEVTHSYKTTHSYVTYVTWLRDTTHSYLIQTKGWVMSHILSHSLAAAEANDYSRQTVVSHISDSFICDQIKGWVMSHILSHGLAAAEANDSFICEMTHSYVIQSRGWVICECVLITHAWVILHVHASYVTCVMCVYVLIILHIHEWVTLHVHESSAWCEYVWNEGMSHMTHTHIKDSFMCSTWSNQVMSDHKHTQSRTRCLRGKWLF